MKNWKTIAPPPPPNQKEIRKKRLKNIFMCFPFFFFFFFLSLLVVCKARAIDTQNPEKKKEFVYSYFLLKLCSKIEWKIEGMLQDGVVLEKRNIRSEGGTLKK